MDRYNPKSLLVGTVQGHLSHFNQKPLLMEPTRRCKVKIPKIQESMMASGVRSMLSKGTTEVCPLNKGLFIYPFLIPYTNGESCFIFNLKPLNQLIACTNFRMSTLKMIREATVQGNEQFHATSSQHSSTFQLQGDIIIFFTSGGEAKSTSSGTCP